MLLGRNFDFLDGYLLVTARYLVVTNRYLMSTGGYCLSLVVTVRYRSLLLVPTLHRDEHFYIFKHNFKLNIKRVIFEFYKKQPLILVAAVEKGSGTKVLGLQLYQKMNSFTSVFEDSGHIFMKVGKIFRCVRSGSRTAATSKMEHFALISQRAPSWLLQQS